MGTANPLHIDARRRGMTQMSRRPAMSLRRTAAALLACTCLTGGAAFAQDAAWVGGNAGDPNDWVEDNNWTPAATPTGTATFGNVANTTTVANDNGLVAIGAINFTSTALAYTINIDNPFLITGTGVVNNSANTQTFNVTSGNQLVFQNGSSANSGPGTVTYNNNGGFISFNDTSTAGNSHTNIINNGVVQFNNNSNAGSANITNNVQLDFFDSSSASNATIANNAGTITFNNSATAANAAVTNDGGTIIFNNTSNAGSANIASSFNNVTLTHASVTFNNSSSAGSATFTSNPANFPTYTFNDTSTAANANFVLVDATLTFNNSSSAGNATLNMPNSFHPATITFHDTSTAGNAVITNVGVDTLGTGVTFLDASSAGNATITNNPNIAVPGEGGVLIFGNRNGGGTDTADAGTATIINNAGGSTSFFGFTSGANANIINNSGGSTAFEENSTAANAHITNNSGGSVIFFAGAPTAGNAVIVNNAGGTVEFGLAGFYPLIIDTATAGNATITNDGTVTFSSQTTAGNATITTNSGGLVSFVEAATGGNARFITNAGGIFDMSGLTTGGMTAGSIEGAGSYFLGSKALTVGSNNLSTTVSGVISDGGTSGGTGGSLIKVGTGTLTLTNTETYTGATTVDGGALNVTGSIALSGGVTVNSGGTLEGTGTVSSTTVNSGGTLAPGSGAIGTLAVSGSLAFLSGAIYLVQVNPTTASLTTVTGSATLNGTVDAVFAPGTYTQKQYVILAANGGVIGTFSALDTVNLPANITASLSYSANDVFLNLKASLPTTGLNINQQNVANALNNFFNGGGALPPSFMPIFNLTGVNLANALTQLDGEVATGADKGAFLLMDEFLGLMLDPFVDGRRGGQGSPMNFAPDRAAAFPPDVALAYAGVLKAPPAAAAFAQRWTTWGSAFGGGGFTQGNAVIGSTNINAQAAGFAGGMDYHVSPDTVVGFGLAGGETGWSLAQGLGTGRSDAFQAGLYGVTHAGPAYLAAAVAGAEHWMSTSRVALGDHLTASFNAEAYGGRVEAGYRYGVWSGVGVTPYAAAQIEAFHTPFYREADLTAGGFGLAYNAQNATDTRSELGFRLDHFSEAWGMPLLLRARVAWAHDWASNPALTATFQALPGASFIVNGAGFAPDSALVTAGSELRLTPRWALLTKFDGEFAPTAQTYAGSGTLRYSW